MNEFSEAIITVQDVPHLLLKYKRSIIACGLIGLSVFTTAAFVLPPKFKVSFVLTLNPRYFQSPLVGEFVPGMGDGGDMKSQGESLLRETLTPEFLDSLGQKYQLYSYLRPHVTSDSLYRRMRSGLKTLLVQYGVMSQPLDESYELALARQELVSHIEIFNAFGTTYSIGFISSNPDVSFNVVQDIYTQSIRALLDIRSRNLIEVRDAVARRLESLSGDLSNTPSAPPQTSTVAAPDDTRVQLAQVQNEITQLSAQYTDEHPTMQLLRRKEYLLKSRLHSSDNAPETPLVNNLRKPAEGAASSEIYSDLTRKLNYLKIAIDSDQERQSDYFNLLQAPLYPSAPIWPKKPLMACLGLGLGLFAAIFSAALREYFDRSALHADTLAHHLQLPLLGSMPVFSTKSVKKSAPLIGSPAKPSTSPPPPTRP